MLWQKINDFQRERSSNSNKEDYTKRGADNLFYAKYFLIIFMVVDQVTFIQLQVTIKFKGMNSIVKFI